MFLFFFQNNFLEIYSENLLFAVFLSRLSKISKFSLCVFSFPYSGKMENVNARKKIRDKKYPPPPQKNKLLIGTNYKNCVFSSMVE